MSESFCSAGGVDSWFLQQFPHDKRIVIPELSVVHIAHATNLGAGWNGNGRGWRQCGMLTAIGFIPTEPVPDSPTVRLRLTDTAHGESVEIESDGHSVPWDVVHPDGNGGLVFNGRNVGGCHIHVAYFAEQC